MTVSDTRDYEDFLMSLNMSQEDVDVIVNNEKDRVDVLENFLAVGYSEIHGLGIFALKDINPDYYSVSRKGSMRTYSGRFTNHSVEPNCEAQILGEDIVFRPTREIDVFEELTVSYRQVAKVNI